MDLLTDPALVIKDRPVSTLMGNWYDFIGTNTNIGPILYLFPYWFLIHFLCSQKKSYFLHFSIWSRPWLLGWEAVALVCSETITWNDYSTNITTHTVVFYLCEMKPLIGLGLSTGRKKKSHFNIVVQKITDLKIFKYLLKNIWNTIMNVHSPNTPGHTILTDWTIWNRFWTGTGSYIYI